MQLFVLARLEVVKLPCAVALKCVVLGLVLVYAAVVEVVALNLVVGLLH